MSKQINRVVLSSFVILEAIALYLILFSNISHDVVCIIQATSILLAMVVSALAPKTRLNIILMLALVFTFVSDFLLEIWYDSMDGGIIPQTLAMFTFLVVQLLYAYYISKVYDNRSFDKISLFVRVAISIIAVTLSIVICGPNLLLVVTMTYFANILLNVIFGLMHFKKFPLFVIGLVLYILCDIYLGLNIARESFLTISESTLLYKILSIGFNFTWFFYLPGQTLLCLNVHRNNQRKKTC